MKRLQFSKPWTIAACAMVLFIWGNSLVPGQGSGSFSLAVMQAIHSFLGTVGLPYEWVTNFVVRKCGHFTEYAVLGMLVSNAFDRDASHHGFELACIALALMFVPCADETIQLFVEGRSGQITDVLLDCSGAATGAFLRYLFARLRRPKA